MLEYFALGHVPGPETIFQGVRQVRHSHFLRVTPHGIEEHSYYRRPSEAGTAAVGDEEIEHALSEAVSLRMRADVPVAALLSGGVDSSLITAFAQGSVDRQIQTFSFGWKGHPDELTFAREMADFVGTRHHEVELDRALFFDDIDGVIAAMDAPQADSAVFVVFQLAKEIAQNGVKVVLSGDGGDELFGGYPWYRGTTGLKQIARKLLRGPERTSNDYISGRHHFQQDELQCIFGENLVRDFVAGLQSGCTGCGNTVSGRIALDYDGYLPWGLMPKIDRMSMAHSVEVRAPLLDHHLIALWSSLPDRDKVGGNELKARIKRYCRTSGKIPAGFADRRKTGMNLPLTWWVRSNEGFFRDTIQGAQSRTSALFGLPLIHSWFDSIREHKFDGWSKAAQKIWSAAIFELWHQHLKRGV